MCSVTLRYNYLSFLHKNFQELSTCSESHVSRSGSTGDLIKHLEPRDSIQIPQHSSSPTSILSASLERITLTERHDIFCRLEFAKRSITEAMSMLQVQPLPVDTAHNKVTAQCSKLFVSWGTTQVIN
jgi:hypothetical protein